MQLIRRRDGQDTTLLDIPDWRFHWQGGYFYVDPIAIRSDDLLVLRCTYDNSNEHRAQYDLGPSVDVSFGEASTDEMCRAGLGIVDSLP